MELYNKAVSGDSDPALYRALSAGDLPAAWLLSKSVDKDNPASAFNCGLCLFGLEEWESCLAELKRAEHLLGNPPEFDIADRSLFIKALSVSKAEKALFELPLDPESSASCTRYGLIRVRWLTVHCLVKLGRNSEAEPIKRFLSQYIDL